MTLKRFFFVLSTFLEWSRENCQYDWRHASTNDKTATTDGSNEAFGRPSTSRSNSHDQLVDEFTQLLTKLWFKQNFLAPLLFYTFFLSTNQPTNQSSIKSPIAQSTYSKMSCSNHLPHKTTLSMIIRTIFLPIVIQSYTKKKSIGMHHLIAKMCSFHVIFF